MATSCKTPYAAKIVKEKEGSEKIYFVHFGFCRVDCRRVAKEVDAKTRFAM